MMTMLSTAFKFACALVLIGFWLQAGAIARQSNDFCKGDSGVEIVNTSQLVTESFLQKMKSVGVSIIGRYYGYGSETVGGKRLRAEEIELIDRSNFALVVIFESAGDRPQKLKDWEARGRNDAIEARNLAERLGQPPVMSAIYFGVDESSGGSSSNPFDAEIKAYFGEIVDVMGFTGTGARHFSIGVYGSRATCRILKEADLVDYCWLSHGPGNTGGAGVSNSSNYDIEQYVPGECGGRSIAFSRLKPGQKHVGQFKVGGVATDVLSDVKHQACGAGDIEADLVSMATHGGGPSAFSEEWRKRYNKFAESPYAEFLSAYAKIASSMSKKWDKPYYGKEACRLLMPLFRVAVTASTARGHGVEIVSGEILKQAPSTGYGEHIEDIGSGCIWHPLELSSAVPGPC